MTLKDPRLWQPSSESVGAARASDATSPLSLPSATALLTKVEVATLVLGLEEAPSGLGVHVSSLGHQQLHVVLAAPLYGNVQGRLAWEEGSQDC